MLVTTSHRGFRCGDTTGRKHVGFTLIATVAVMALLAVIAMGMLSLSTVQIRQSSLRKYDQEAKANARLALILAIGELQKQAGPDQRVTASAGILDQNPDTVGVDGVKHPHWTVVWRTTLAEGQPMWVRDDADGGLKDRRISEGWERDEEVLSYLVSGNEGGRRAGADRFLDARSAELSQQEEVELVGEGSVGANLEDGRVVVSQVAVETGLKGSGSGHYGYWVGDLGVRANVATKNKYAGHLPDPDHVETGGFNRLLASQEAEASLMASRAGLPVLEITEESKRGLISSGQLELTGEAAPDALIEWNAAHFHDVTVHSSGVLVNVREGRLKRDLTAYFLSDGEIPGIDLGGGRSLPGLRDDDRLVGPANEGQVGDGDPEWSQQRHRSTSPRFGILRDWARLQDDVDILGVDEKFVLPKIEPKPNLVKLARSADVNLNPVSIADADAGSLHPVLVEGSMYSTFSYHDNPAAWEKKYNIRFHVFPRVVLWNPHSVEMELDPSIVMMTLNGRRDFRTDGLIQYPGVQFYYPEIMWTVWGGGRNDSIREGEHIIESEMYNDPYSGSYYFSIPKTKFGPGECLVFSPATAQEYDSNELNNNWLSCEVAPDQSRNYYFSSAEYDEDESGGGFNFVPSKYWYEPSRHRIDGETWTQSNQADDARMVLKSLDGQSSVSMTDVDELPQIAYISCSHQFGAGREPMEAWDQTEIVRMEKTDLRRPVLKNAPDRRTREGYRMRWFNEHPSNADIPRDPLRGTGYQETALVGNWNVRATYTTRSPWDNVGGDPGDGLASGPWYFGAYTRDLYDEAVGWTETMPVLRNGRFHGNPFGQPVEGLPSYVLFDVPRSDIGVLSLGQLQHAKLSEFIWHPSYIVGQSLVDPRLGGDREGLGLEGTSPRLDTTSKLETGGFDKAAIGWSSDSQRSTDHDEWARFGRAIFQNYSEEDQLVYDISYEVNHTLWDDFFLSTGTKEDKGKFLGNPVDAPLPNGRHVLVPGIGGVVSVDSLTDFHRSASQLMVDGAFNVNSTSVEAWKAILGATRKLSDSGEEAIFPRVLNAPGRHWDSSQFADEPAAWSGVRALDDDELARLAEEIVFQVKLRGPFLSLSDFVNRRLTNDETGRMGPLQAAIESAGLNERFKAGTFFADLTLRNDASLPDYDHPDNIADASRLEQTLKPDSKAWGATTYLTQGDLLQVLGPMLAPRSDTFVVRAYGDAVDGNGVVQARAWCEAIVQRRPEPVSPDDSGLNSKHVGTEADFGRRFEVTSFRWLSPNEI
jgi:type II secretory pathway pseudopilin PulG